MKIKDLAAVLLADVKIIKEQKVENGIVNCTRLILFEGDLAAIENEQQRNELFNLYVDLIQNDDKKLLITVTDSNIAPVSHKVLSIMSDLLCCKDAAAPNIVDELVYEAIVDDIEPGCIPEDIAEAAAQLASLLVSDVGQYR